MTFIPFAIFFVISYSIIDLILSMIVIKNNLDPQHMHKLKLIFGMIAFTFSVVLMHQVSKNQQ